MTENDDRLDQAEKLLNELDSSNQGLVTTAGPAPRDHQLDQLIGAIHLVLEEVRSMR